MSARHIAASLALASFAAYGQALLDDATIGKLVKAGIGEQTVVAMINQQPGKYALSSDDILTLKKAGVSDKILAAMIVRNAAAGVLALRDATPIRLRMTHAITSATAKVGDPVDFEAMDDLKIDGVAVITRGATATAMVAEAGQTKLLARSGKLAVKVTGIRLATGEKAALRMSKEARGDGMPDAMVAAKVNWTAAPLVFVGGRDVTFPEGTEITAYIDGDINLERDRFGAAGVPPATMAGPAPGPVAQALRAAAADGLLDTSFTSNPQGALVTMYGSPIGRTPFNTRLAPGKYTVVFSADGYTDLTEFVTVGPGLPNVANGPFELQ